MRIEGIRSSGLGSAAQPRCFLLPEPISDAIVIHRTPCLPWQRGGNSRGKPGTGSGRHSQNMRCIWASRLRRSVTVSLPVYCPSEVWRSRHCGATSCRVSLALNPPVVPSKGFTPSASPAFTSTTSTVQRTHGVGDGWHYGRYLCLSAQAVLFRYAMASRSACRTVDFLTLARQRTEAPADLALCTAALAHRIVIAANASPRTIPSWQTDGGRRIRQLDDFRSSSTTADGVVGGGHGTRSLIYVL